MPPALTGLSLLAAGRGGRGGGGARRVWVRERMRGPRRGRGARDASLQLLSVRRRHGRSEPAPPAPETEAEPEADRERPLGVGRDVPLWN